MKDFFLFHFIRYGKAYLPGNGLHLYSKKAKCKLELSIQEETALHLPPTPVCRAVHVTWSEYSTPPHLVKISREIPAFMKGKLEVSEVRHIVSVISCFLLKAFKFKAYS